MNYTVFGSKGFIGKALVERLKKDGHEPFCPPRNYKLSPEKNLGHVIYCIGLTADFRRFPIETVHAHVSRLVEILEKSKFESFVYLSSTRVYQRTKVKVADETSPTVSLAHEPGDLYNLSKLLGEAICHSYQNKKIKVVRLSNVIGEKSKGENFLDSILKEIATKKCVTLVSSPRSEKDYIHIDDVTQILSKIHRGKHSVYNIASGKNVTTSEILTLLQQHLDFSVIRKGNELSRFPRISISRLKTEFGFKPINILKALPMFETIRKSQIP